MQQLFLYIDPGSGSFLLQAIIGACLGIVFFFKTLKYRFMSLLRRKKDTEPEP